MVSNVFYFHPYLGTWSNLTNVFQMGWNHQPVINWDVLWIPSTLLRIFVVTIVVTCLLRFLAARVANKGRLWNIFREFHTGSTHSSCDLNKNCSWFSWFICVKHPVADHQELGQISCHFRKQKTNLKISLTCLQSYNSCWNPGKFMVKLGPNFCQCQAPPLWKTMVANYPLIFGLLMIAGRGIAIP